MLHPGTRAALAVALAITALAAAIFARRQNVKGGLGGRISRPKIAWLFYSVFVYFLLCPALAADGAVREPFRWVLGFFAVSMWVRGVAELLLLYVFRRWKPPLGIAHDVLCLAQIGISLAWLRGGWAWTLGTFDRWVLAFIGLVSVSLVLEIVYAGLFFQAVHGRTTGEEGVWFADEDARFRRINRLTATLDVPLFGFLAAFLAVCFGLWPAA